MSICHFCERDFPSDQAVKAHLRWCPEYSQSKKGLPRGEQPAASSFNTVTSPHRNSLTSNETASNPFGGFLDQIARQFPGPDEATRLKQKREALLMKLCSSLVDWYFPLEGVITPEMAAAAKIAIIEELGRLAIDDMPHSELTLRGTVIRNRIFGPYLRQQKKEKDGQLTIHKEEQRRSQQDTARHARRTTRKAVLVELGVSRALKGSSSRGIPARVFPLLEWEIRARLDAWLAGDETEPEVNETIEAAIERPLLEWSALVQQVQHAKQERLLNHCLELATPVASAAWPWLKDTLIKQVCETFGMQPHSTPEAHRHDEGAASETATSPTQSEEPTPRKVRRRRVRRSGPIVNENPMVPSREQVSLKEASPEWKRAAS